METRSNSTGDALLPTSDPVAGRPDDSPVAAGRPRMDFLLALLVFLLSFLLVSPEFLPPINEINPFDEAGYVNKGRELAMGSLSPLAESPLSSLLYAPVYLAVEGAPDWFTIMVHAGRAAMFTLLWLGTFLSARELLGKNRAFILAGVFLVSTAASGLLHNASDALFTAMSAFCLWQVLTYHNRGHPRNLVAASAFAGLAALARGDGLVLFTVALVPSAVLASPKGDRLRRLPHIFLPFLILVGGYIGLQGASTGDFALGTLERTYGAFEQGEWVMLTDIEGDPWMEASARAQQLYGTSEENNGSVIRAIARNPSAFAARLARTARTLPEGLLSAYNKRLATILFLFAALGIAALLRQKRRVLAVIFLLWPLHLVTYFVTFFREGYLLFATPVVLLLAAFGIHDSIGSGRPAWLKSLPVIGLAGLSLLGWLTAKPAILVGALVPLLAMAVASAARGWSLADRTHVAMDFLLLLCAGLIVHGSYPFPNYPPAERTPMQAAVIYMGETLPEGSNLATYASMPAWAARLRPIALAGHLRGITDPEELLAWMDDQGIVAIYVDPALRQMEAGLWGMIESQIGEALEVGFEQDPGGFMVLLPAEAYP
jgi:hypothetical protein